MIGRKRFWKEVSVAPQDAGQGVFLDGRPLRTPEQNALSVPTRALAEAIAEEWSGIEGEIQPDTLPFTRAANTAIDRVSARRDPVVDMLAAYGETDLLCYRADGPEALQARQSEAWDPWLDWSRRELSAPLHAVVGVMHQPQPAESLIALRGALEALDPFELTGIHDLVTLSGSLVLGLAVARDAIDADSAWVLSRLDELWQIEQWGEDAEAEALARRKWEAFLRAERFLQLVRG
ncbi:ATP12 family chaperone protein [Amaricoccus macauensis]|uniref:ATP12 family chaperone protein n=1 Tax=Amaricoccus macauensis TaxID=57001 RepID=UPI003C7E6E44